MQRTHSSKEIYLGWVSQIPHPTGGGIGRSESGGCLIRTYGR